MREINEAGLQLIKISEGIVDGNKLTPNFDPYLDPEQYWTIGWGHLITFKNRALQGVKDKKLAYSLYPDGLTLAQCESLLKADTLIAARDVSFFVKVSLTNNEFSALVCFVFNIGGAAFGKSTMCKLLNKKDFVGASKQFDRWVYSGGKKYKGLVARREKEKELFLLGDTP